MNRPLLRAEAIIVHRHDQSILVQCAADEAFYRFPGGTVEFGETAAEAIRRELIEEFDLQAEIGAIACVNESIVEYDGKQRHDCTILHWGAVNEERIQDAIAHSEAEGIQLTWRTMEQLRGKPVYPEGILAYLEERKVVASHLVVRKNYDNEA
ncbi:NUDIX domain-containing protein [Paenibacillus rhizovicinus]|uniref:NUDIX domain-containing protein n=1 Tax=Paenibacillus rhizovicinus TaxID=2704463 RepID=A0A6C0P897_9BACL|nr:NUDIX domain-containing protein [Paenibacillus rhizovicinus]QHW34768.1 NUDIX domain-containing protein [Paenibacillus rhizovicinus]